MPILLLAAGPTFAFAIRGGDLISDDFWLLYAVRRSGVMGAFAQLATSGTGRPVSALGLSVLHGTTNGHPLPALVVLGLLNAGVAVLVLRVAEALLPRRMAWITALAWSALANRGSTRLWLANLPGILSLLLLLVGVLCLVGAKRRPGLAGLALTLSILAYEGSVLLALVAVAFCALAAAGRERRRMLCIAVPVLVAFGYVMVMTPKLASGGPSAFAGAGGFLAAQVGAGVFGTSALTMVGLGLVVLRLAVAIGRMAVPGFSLTASDRWTVAGAALMGLGGGPFVAAGFPFATDGLFDRGNIFAGLGTALLLASVAEMAFEAAAARPAASWAACAAAGLALLCLAAQNLTDLSDYRRAVVDGQALVAQLEQDLPAIPPGGVLVGPPLPTANGVASFVLRSDLPAALAVRNHRSDVPDIVSVAETSKEEEQGFSQTWLYDRHTRNLSRRVPNARALPS